MRRAAIILAAGQGTRMNSDLPKVLHCINELPLISYVIDAISCIELERILVVVGYRAEDVINASAGSGIEFVFQKTQLGTGHAVMQCEESLSDFEGTVMLLNGDVPGLRPATIAKFIDFHESESAAATVLTAVLDDPAGYGRIIRESGGALLKIIEEQDASAEEKLVKEINSGLFCFGKDLMFESLKEISRKNTQNEYYLTDVIEILGGKSKKVGAFCIEDPMEVAGVNTVDELISVQEYIESRVE